MATSKAKEKAVEKTLQRLEPTLQRKLNGFDVCVELYGLGQLTFAEYEGIKNEHDVYQANKKLLSAIHRRGPDILDALIEALSEEADANKHIIDKIKDGTWMVQSVKRARGYFCAPSFSFRIQEELR